MKPIILLVEDDPTLQMIISDTLMSQSFEVITAGNGLEGIERFKENVVSLIIADIMMPEMDGIEMTKRIRRYDEHVPIIFLTAKSEIEDIEEAFEIGGNDYLQKPFKMRELIARIKALLRFNSPTPTKLTTVELGNYYFCPDLQTLSIGEYTRKLTGIEARLLLLLYEGSTVGMTYNELMTTLWGRDDVYNRNSLHGFIHRLRKYLAEDSNIEIINMRGYGYKLVIETPDKNL